ncbi:MAG: flagellar hook-basal body complex protein FliE [Clostridiales bacterium]|jgi:flagellar hook-basal body complex protein FliE|nr:flagellar hook-basal body complex protein FliE [Clostridiales bacterium]
MGAVFSTITPIKRMEFSENIAGKEPINSEGSLPFQSILNDSLKQLASAEEAAAQDSINLALGNADDLAQIQINSLKAQAALQTTVQLTSRAINAYKEIMQMQI